MSSRVGRRRGLTAALVLAASSASTLSAQSRSEPREGRTWSLRGIRDAYCVRFLVEPGVAAKGLRDGFLLVQASQDQSLHPALRRVIENQPQFASWTPSAVCLYYMDAVEAGGRRFSVKGGRRAQLLGVWSLATRQQGTGHRRDLALNFFAGRHSLITAAEISRLRLHEAESSVSPVTESSDSEYNVKIGKTRLIWKGHAAGDSVQVERPVEESWLLNGLSGNVWAAQMTLRPAWRRDVAGVLSIEGKDDLAKALKASPIRFVGPLYRGGEGTLRLSR